MTAPESSPLGSAKPAAAVIARDYAERVVAYVRTHTYPYDHVAKAILEANAAIQRGDGQTDLRSADDWLKEYPGLVVMDPDGWDRSNYEASWAERITRNEFEKRVAESTCKYPAGFFDKFATPPAAKPNETSGATPLWFSEANERIRVLENENKALRELNAAKSTPGVEQAVAVLKKWVDWYHTDEPGHYTPITETLKFLSAVKQEQIGGAT